MMSATSLNQDMQKQLWAGCVHTATYLGKINSMDGETCFFNRLRVDIKKPALNIHLISFGEALNIAVRQDIKAKLAPRGIRVIFVDYIVDLHGDVYQFYDPVTSRVKTSRDYIILNYIWHT